MRPTKEQYLSAIVTIEKFSPAPRVLAKALTLLRDPDSDLETIGALIKSDPALTADIIRGANSAYFGAGERVTSLDRAVQKIGFRESIRLLNLAVAHTLSARDLGSYGIAAEDFWAESLFNGLLLEELARVCGQGDPDEAHTIGLLRYIGRLAINQAIHDLGGGLFWDASAPIEEWELAEVGFPQTHAAAALLRAWQFTPTIVQAIEWQNEPTVVAPDLWAVHALRLARHILEQCAGSAMASIMSDYPLGQLPDSPIVETSGLSLASLNAILQITRERFHAINTNLYD